MRVLAAVLLLLAACGAPSPEATNGTETLEAEGAITPADLAGRLRSGDVPIVLDVRTPEEFAEGHVPGALNVPHAQLPARLGEVAAYRDAELVVHCQSGRRAANATRVLLKAGFQRVRDLEGHWQAWQAGGHPTE